MGKSSYIKLRNGSTLQEITLDKVKELLTMYIERTVKTGELVSWEYDEAAFPYSIEEKEEGTTKYLYLKGNGPLYNYLLIGVGKEELDGETTPYIQIVLPDEDHLTPGDFGKGSEFAKYIARYLKAELQMFNDRILYFNPRK